MAAWSFRPAYFYPRPPRGGRHMDDVTIYAAAKFLSTPSARRATRAAAFRPPSNGISIHALREEGDPERQERKDREMDFYPRPPRGGRHPVVGQVYGYGQFLSTPSARRATRPSKTQGLRSEISIHALREEGDPPSRRPVQILWIFLSTPSARRATLKNTVCVSK